MLDYNFSRETNEVDRGLSFFDAIYGVAITLLIVGIDPPAADEWASWTTLVESGVLDQLVTGLISFAVITSFWKVNHSVMARVVRLDRAIINANLVAAAFVVLIPFTSSALGEPGVSDLAWPTAIYAGVIVLASLAQRAIYVVAKSRGVLAPDPEPRTTAWAEFAGSLITPVVFLASIPVAFQIHSDAARITWLSLVVFAPLAHLLIKHFAVSSNNRTGEAGGIGPASAP